MASYEDPCAGALPTDKPYTQRPGIVHAPASPHLAALRSRARELWTERDDAENAMATAIDMGWQQAADDWAGRLTQLDHERARVVREWRAATTATAVLA